MQAQTRTGLALERRHRRKMCRAESSGTNEERTGLCFLLQTFGQKYAPPTTAALLLTLESVFGTLFSVAFYHEHLEPRVIVGFALILVAILISETKLKFLRRRMA